MTTIDRRQFLRTSITAVGASLAVGVPAHARVRRVASDQVHARQKRRHHRAPRPRHRQQQRTGPARSRHRWLPPADP